MSQGGRLEDLLMAALMRSSSASPSTWLDSREFHSSLTVPQGCKLVLLSLDRHAARHHMQVSQYPLLLLLIIFRAAPLHQRVICAITRTLWPLISSLPCSRNDTKRTFQWLLWGHLLPPFRQDAPPTHIISCLVPWMIAGSNTQCAHHSSKSVS